MKLKIAAVAVGLAFAVPAFADYGGINQYGNDNYANIDQTNSGAGAYVYQTGDRNHVGAFYEGYGDYPGIQQYNVNSGYVQTQQIGNDNWAWAYQYGGDNQVISIQQGGWRWDGENSTDYGAASNNSASFNQYAYGGANQSINAFQAGTGNYAYGWQQGSDNTMTVFQNGSYNYAVNLNQYGAGGAANVMNVTQTGTNNRAGDWYYYSGVSQSGSGNQMDIAQNGSSNTVYQAQQYGSNNVMSIAQSGVGHYAYAYQSGGGNVAHITQH
jgi:hypothetical protein